MLLFLQGVSTAKVLPTIKFSTALRENFTFYTFHIKNTFPLLFCMLCDYLTFPRFCMFVYVFSYGVYKPMM